MLRGYLEFTDARFGFAMATVGDISQDKLTDVVIGAPLEGFGADDGASFGSVYIYNGRWDGLSTRPSQVTPLVLSCLHPGALTSPRCASLSLRSAPVLSFRQFPRGWEYPVKDRGHLEDPGQGLSPDPSSRARDCGNICLLADLYLPEHLTWMAPRHLTSHCPTECILFPQTPLGPMAPSFPSDT